MENPNAGKVVNVTNITDSDFTHPYGGAPFTIKAGETMTFPWDVGEHLAKHLARKILISKDRGATQWNGKDDTANNGLGSVLWNEETEKSMMSKILGDSWTREIEAPKTEIEKLKAEIAALNEFRKSLETSGAATHKGRKELIEELKAAGGAFTPSDTNEDIVKKIAEIKNKV